MFLFCNEAVARESPLSPAGEGCRTVLVNALGDGMRRDRPDRPAWRSVPNELGKQRMTGALIRRRVGGLRSASRGGCSVRQTGPLLGKRMNAPWKTHSLEGTAGCEQEGRSNDEFGPAATIRHPSIACRGGVSPPEPVQSPARRAAQPPADEAPACASHFNSARVPVHSLSVEGA